MEPEEASAGLAGELPTPLAFADRTRSTPASAPGRVRSGASGALYGRCARHPWLMQLVGRVAWGVDASVLYSSMRLFGSLQDVSIAEVPCPGGVAVRALRRGQDVRYLACDEDSRMLARARRRARRRSLTHSEFHRAPLSALPFADGEIDVFLCYGVLIDDGPAALVEIARCLRPGGRLIGATFFSDISRRGAWLFGLGARRGHPLPPGREDMYAWMREAGLVQGTLGPDYGFACFWARKASDRVPLPSSGAVLS